MCQKHQYTFFHIFPTFFRYPNDIASRPSVTRPEVAGSKSIVLNKQISLFFLKKSSEYGLLSKICLSYDNS